MQGDPAYETESRMRYLYVFDPDKRRIVEFRDITTCSVDEREQIRLDMLSAALFPLGVMDSLEDGFPDPAPFGVFLASSRFRAASVSQHR